MLGWRRRRWANINPGAKNVSRDEMPVVAEYWAYTGQYWSRAG